MMFQCRIIKPKIPFASLRLPNSQASKISLPNTSMVVFAGHHGLRPRDQGGEEPVQFLDVHRLAVLTAFEEVSKAVEFGVGERLISHPFLEKFNPRNVTARLRSFKVSMSLA